MKARSRAVARGGPGWHMPPPVLADQLTLSQPGGAHYPHPVIKIFRPCDGPEKPLFEQQFMYVFMPNSINLGNMTNLKIYQILFQYLFTYFMKLCHGLPCSALLYTALFSFCFLSWPLRKEDVFMMYSKSSSISFSPVFPLY